MSASGDPRGPSRPRPRSERVDAGGVRVATLFGIPIYVTRAWFVIAAAATLLFQGHIASRVPGIGSWSFVVGAGLFLLLYGSVLLHELGHSLVALRFGLPVRRITLQFLGGVSEIEEEAPTPGREFAVAVIGPVVSLVLGVVLYAMLLVLDVTTVVGSVVEALAWSNVIVGVFNLLPGLPLDGGRVLRAVIWKVVGSQRRATTIAAHAGRVIAALVAIGGVYYGLVVLSPPDPFTLVIAALLAAFIWAGANQTVAAAAVRDRVAGISVRALTRRAVPVRADVPLSEAIRQAREAGAGALVVVGPDGSPTAVVSEAAVAATPEARRPWMRVSDVARQLAPGLRVSTALDGGALLQIMRDTPASEYLVVEPEGAVYGVLASSDVERALTHAPA